MKDRSSAHTDQQGQNVHGDDHIVKPSSANDSAAQPRSRARRLLLVALVVSACVASFSSTASAETFTIGGGYPTMVRLSSQGMTRGFQMPSTSHGCYGAGIGVTPQIASGGVRATPVPNTNSLVQQTIWRREWIEWSKDGFSWHYYKGGTAWQRQNIFSWESRGVAFGGGGYTVAPGWGYRIVEEIVWTIGNTRLGSAISIPNVYSYRAAGRAVPLVTQGGSAACAFY